MKADIASYTDLYGKVIFVHKIGLTFTRNCFFSTYRRPRFTNQGALCCPKCVLRVTVLCLSKITPQVHGRCILVTRCVPATTTPPSALNANLRRKLRCDPTFFCVYSRLFTSNKLSSSPRCTILNLSKGNAVSYLAVMLSPG